MESVIEHLGDVYFCLALSTLVAGISVISTAIIVSNVLHLTIISAVGSVPFFLLILLTPDKCSTHKDWRIGFLFGFAGFSGIGVTELFKNALSEKPTLLLTTLLDTMKIFICLSACAIFSGKDRWIFIGMPLTCILFTILVISFANVFDQSYTVSKTLVYLSLFTICGLVLYDTQVIMQKFENGDRDVIRRGMPMFTNFFGIYRRLLILAVSKHKQEKYFDDGIQEDDQNLHFSGSVPSLVPINDLS